MNAKNIVTEGGALELEKETTHVVSFWVIPNGTRWDGAYGDFAFFRNEEDAKRFCAKYEKPPESSVLMSVDQYLKTKH